MVSAESDSQTQTTMSWIMYIKHHAEIILHETIYLMD